MRYWASPIPLWRCSNEACNEVICIGSVKELQSLASNFEEVYKNKEIDLHRPYVDKLLIRCKKCNSKMIRIKEVLDCWFESASMPFAELHYPFENERRFQERYPADFVAEYIAQTRAWFYVMLVVNGTLFGKPPFKNVIATGTILSESGEKLSKSKRNFPDPWIMIEKYGADALRLYLLSSQVVDGRDLFFSEHDLKNIFSGSILKILNLGKLYKFYNISSIVEKNKLGVNDIHEVKELINKWVLSFIYYKKNQIKQKLDNYETQKACREVINLIDEISLFYVKYAKELIKNEDKETSIVFTWVLYQLSKIIAPVMPFMGEYLYKLIPFQREKSIHLEDFDDLNYPIDDVLLNNIKLVKTILNSGLSLRKENRIKLRYPVRCIYININLDSQILRFIKKALNAKAIMVAPDFAKLNLENLLVKENETIKIAMDRILDSDLISEGLISDLIRCINNVRKKLNLYPGEQAVVDIFYDKETSSQIPDIIKANIKKIMSATYSKRIRIFDYFPEEEKKCFEAEIGLNKKHRVRIKIYKGQ
jgi:isoleucyl-tRNA synthetase